MGVAQPAFGRRHQPGRYLGPVIPGKGAGKGEVGIAPLGREALPGNFVFPGDVQKRRQHGQGGNFARTGHLRHMKQPDALAGRFPGLQVHIGHRRIGGAQVDADDVLLIVKVQGLRSPAH